jgi:hypothetical protein
MYPHRIRLHGPWEIEPVARLLSHAKGAGQSLQTPVGSAMRVTMPFGWNDGPRKSVAGRVRFRRRFGYPGRIDAYERVWLTFVRFPGPSDITLNGTMLGHREGHDPVEFDVTQLLKERNELIVQVDVPDDRSGLWGEVALEIRCTAFLRSIGARRIEGERPTLEVTGEVVGTSAGPLELYVLVDGATQHYGFVEAKPDGAPFRVQVNPTTICSQVVRVDLVQGAMLWYAVERAVM